MSTALDAQLFTSQFFEDPYPVLHELRAQDSVHWSDTWGCWMLLNYRDVVAAFRDPRFSSNKMTVFASELPAEVRQEVQPLVRVLSSFLGASDPPDHTRLRRLVNKAFTPPVVEGMRKRIQAIVDNLLDGVEPRGGMDAIADFAYPAPATVITEMLGLPPEDVPRFKKWSDDIVSFIGAGRPTTELAERGQHSLLALTEYYRPILEQRRRAPREDLISALTTAQDQGDHLDDTELLATCVTLLTGGHETTTGLVGNGLMSLLQNPAQLQKLRDDPGLITLAVEELLRYESPVQRAERVTKEDVTVGHTRIARGERVFLMVGAANRDPSQFRDPDHLDLTRRENKHVGFGQGIHFCIGAPLARLEGAIALGSVVRRFPFMRLDTQVFQWQKIAAMRILKSLPVVI